MTVWDVAVVGAGPAGSLAAHQLARGGASVILLDRAAFPRWKVCGGCLSPGALSVLEAAGLGGLAASLGAVPLRRLVLHARGAGASPVTLSGSLALSRAAFDASLVQSAETAGSTFWAESHAMLGAAHRDARELRVRRRDGDHVVRARVVIDATGLGPGLPGASADGEVSDGSRLGLGAVLVGEDHPVEPGDLHMAVGRAGYVGLVRVEGGALTVAAALDPVAVRAASPKSVVGSVLAEVGLPPLCERPLLGWRGTPLLTRSGAGAGDERLLRIGDAAGYVEPFTGEGMCWALSAGFAVAPVAMAGAERWREDLLDDWRTHLGRSLTPSQRLCRLLAWVLRRPSLVRAGVAAVGIAPGLAGPVVSRASRAPAFGRAFEVGV